ncbi:hypothetical protein Pmani_022174 [Petrolisthes manimaculis]|uniref:Galactose-1-phosphate uridylyltransferase n=1 Tax=Petrolisthes manimaculis TaxID=1843537 RepID=A0AAE1PEK2_9EUCA|nr:hypothetical protein Pmani_022174 [Petrolisthes manimaculis]
MLVYLFYHLVYQRTSFYHLHGNHQIINDQYSVFPHFVSKPKHGWDWYLQECFDNQFPDEMEAIFTNALPTWSESLNMECAELYQKFTALYEVHHRYSQSLTLPESFSRKIHRLLKGDQTLVDQVNKQHLIHVYEPLTSDHVVYNPLRAHRPLPTQPMDIFQWVDELSASTAKECDFCRYNKMTARDEFGWHDNGVTLRVSNTFKVEAWHSMMVTRDSHHPTNLTRRQVVSLFKQATSWVQEVSLKNPHYIYPSLAWDTLPPAGASQIHPHLHVFLSPDHYYGTFEGMRAAAQRFLLATGDNYFSTLLEVHAALGLVVEYGDALALAMLGGKGDLEVLLMSDYPSEDLYRLLHFTYLSYHDTFRQPCKSLAGAWPALGTSQDMSRGRIPALLRLVSRGDCLSPKADVSSFELFHVVYRPHDPWQVATAIRSAIKKYDV